MSFPFLLDIRVLFRVFEDFFLDFRGGSGIIEIRFGQGADSV